MARPATSSPPSATTSPAAVSVQPSARPASAAIRVARWKSPLEAHDTARTIRPPSSGSPGNRLKRPTKKHAAASEKSAVGTGPMCWTSSVSGRRAGAERETSSAPAPSATRPSVTLTMGPTMAIHSSALGVGGSRVSRAAPPKTWSVMSRTETPHARAIVASAA